MAWGKTHHSPESDTVDLSKTEPVTSLLSPGINPMDLINPAQDGDLALFGREGLIDTQPLFASPPPMAAPPSMTEPAAATAIKASRSVSPESRLQNMPPLQQQRATKNTSDSKRNNNKRYSGRNLKRKSLSSASDDDESEHSSISPPPATRRCNSGAKNAMTATCSAPKKTAHNMIEKRYRTNLNDKMATLRDSVPALRVMVHRLQHQGSDDDDDDDDGDDDDDDDDKQFGAMGGVEAQGQGEGLSGLAPAYKLNKATILSKATEYITHLERRNRNLAKENAALRGRVECFEMLVMSRGGVRGFLDLSLPPV
jgi:hypothetical protein